MNRSEVFEYIVHLPMQIKVQREGDKFVAVLPAYRLPMGLIVVGDSKDEAIEALRKKVLCHWGGMEE